MPKEIATLSKTLEIIKKNRFNFKKKWGQNFIIDINILKKIVESANIANKTNVIEIGAGIGSLTEQLAKKAYRVISYEIDKSLIPILNETLRDYHNIKIINEDILKADIRKMIKQEFDTNSDIALVANLPYYITTPILMYLLEQKLPINRYCVMMQKEVAQRLCGKSGTKEYNALTIIIQYYTIPKIIMNVPKTVFIPKPNVDSSVLYLEVRDKPIVEVLNEDFFFKVVKGSFMQRRKTIFNNLKQTFIDIEPQLITKALENTNIDPGIRAEALSIESFALLSEALYKTIK